MRVVVQCPKCNTEILETNSDKLIVLSESSVVSADIFKSLIPNIPNPIGGDEIRCPICRTEYFTTLRDVWKIVRRQFMKEERQWDP